MAGERLEAIDLVLNVLREHEKALDDLVARLEDLTGGEEFAAQVVKHGPSLSLTIPAATVRRMGVAHGDKLKVNIRR